MAKARPSGDSPRSDLTALAGARLVTAIETEDGARPAEALIKHLTGGDRLTARTAYAKNAVTFKPQGKLWIATNHRPHIKGTDFATWRRIRLISFNVTIPEEKRDKHLIEKLITELPGLLLWAVEGCLIWQRHGLQTPEAIKEATSTYRMEMDSLQRFINDCCVVEPRAKVKSSELYAQYKVWCESNGEAVLSQTSFSLKLKEKNFHSEKTRNGVYWTGLGLSVTPE